MTDPDPYLERVRAAAAEHVPANDFPEPAYETAFRALATVGDEDGRGGAAAADEDGHGGKAAADEGDLARLADWLIGVMEQSGRAPREDAIRSEARAICDDEGYEIPEDSWLAEEPGGPKSETRDTTKGF